MAWWSRLRGRLLIRTPLFELELESRRLAEVIDKANDERDIRLSTYGEELGNFRGHEVVLAQSQREAEAVARTTNLYRQQLEDHASAMTLPYSRSVHVTFQLLFGIVEYTAAFVAFRTGIPTSTLSEAVLLPLGLVFGLVFCGHTCGHLLKHLHVGHYMKSLSAGEQESLPPPELFGRHSNSFYFVTAFAGLGLVSAAFAALLIRLESDLPVNPLAFLLIAISLAGASTGEAFIWTNPWVHMRDEIDEMERRCTDDLAEVLEDYEMSRASLIEAQARLAELEPKVRLVLWSMRQRLEVLELRARAGTTQTLSAEEVRAAMAIQDEYQERLGDIFRAPPIDVIDLDDRASR